MLDRIEISHHFQRPEIQIIDGAPLASNTGWTREQLLVAFSLYCRLPFGQLDSRNQEIIRFAGLIGRTPSALAMKLSNLASLDPAITSTGRKGLSSASTADKSMWDEMNSDWEHFAAEMQGAIASVTPTVLGAGDQSLDECEPEDYTGRDKEVLSIARIGQDFFRMAVLSAYDYKCCITGLSIQKLLVASHIVPWRTDARSRLNPRNGLCLSMLHDKAFDTGIITIAEDMTVRVSEHYTHDPDPYYKTSLLSFDKMPIALPKKFMPHSDFLSFHRENIFKK